MAALSVALAARRVKGEEDKVFEDYGKKIFSFKEGRRGAYSRPEKLLQAIQVKGVDPPIQSVAPDNENVKGKTDSPSGNQSDVVAGSQSMSEQGHGLSKSVDPSSLAKSAISSGVELCHRINWVPRPLQFVQDRNSTEVQRRAKELAEEFNLPQQVSVRLSLLYQFKDDNVGERMVHIYLDAIKKLKEGLTCSKLCLQSLKVKRKRLELQFPESVLILKSIGFLSVMSGVKRIDTRLLQDLYLGTSQSEEFREVNSKIKALGQTLQESRCCVLATKQRTYSLVMDHQSDLAALCAVVDIVKGRHGPDVWRRDEPTGAVFATPIQARRIG